ncbi:MAG: YIP1 family protein [Gemmatimonadota bacterium]
MSTYLDNETPTTEAPVEKAARWEDFIDIWFSPRQLFARRANDSWAVPMLVIALISLALAFAFRPVQQAMQQAAMAERGMTEEQLAAARNVGGVIGIIGIIFAPIGMTVAVLVASLFTWIAAKIASIDVPLRRALMITTFVTFVTVLQQAIGGVLMSLKLSKGQEIDIVKDNSFGILRFMQPSEINDIVVALLSRIDIFAIWTMVLYAIAFMAAAKAPKGAAWTAAIIIWVIGGLFMLIPAAMS